MDKDISHPPTGRSIGLRCIRRLSSAARLVLYRSLSFDNFSVAWWNAAFWQSGNGNAFHCATRSVTIGSANALDPLVGTLVTTVNSFPSLDSLNIINQEVHVADVFAMLQERNVKYLVLEDVVLHRHKGPIPSLEPVRRECDLLPAASSTVIVTGVPWNVIADPFLLLPKTLGSPNLTFIEIDIRSFTAIVRAFPRVSEMLGANVNRFKMLCSEWHPGAKLQRSLHRGARVMRVYLLGPSSLLAQLDLILWPRGTSTNAWKMPVSGASDCRLSEPLISHSDPDSDVAVRSQHCNPQMAWVIWQCREYVD
ncbi:hypothetical protein PM082_020270 [Marasmius tenuissimus]|nr:hypothetical protein PM082_020270 [Marasmius tenuissimus]